VLSRARTLAGLERDLVQERTEAGLARARRQGKRLGRPRRIDGTTAARIRRLARAGQSGRAIAKQLDTPKSTVANLLRKAG
jgi:DNA invertase Pin-like site-specific DNA recombinase